MLVTYSRAPFGETFNFDIHGRDIDVNPLAAVGGAFLISAAPQVFTHDVREHAPAVACASASSCQVLYQRYSDKEPAGSPAVDAPGIDRVRGRMLTYRAARSGPRRATGPSIGRLVDVPVRELVVQTGRRPLDHDSDRPT